MNDRAAISALVLEAMGDAWSDSEEYSALPGMVADLLLMSDWLAAHDRQVQAEALRDAAADYRSGQLTGIFLGRDAYPRAWLSARADRIEEGSDDDR